MQRFAAAGFDHDGGAELQPGLEVFGNWIGLDDVNHIFFEGPALERMGCGFGSELGRFAGFTVEYAIVRCEAAFFDDRSRRDNLLAGGAGFADFSHVLVALVGGVE